MGWVKDKGGSGVKKYEEGGKTIQKDTKSWREKYGHLKFKPGENKQFDQLDSLHTKELRAVQTGKISPEAYRAKEKELRKLQERVFAKAAEAEEKERKKKKK